MSQPIVFASIAPPITDELRERYDAEESKVSDSIVRDGLRFVSRCFREWWELPESRQQPDAPRVYARLAGVDVSGLLTPLEPQYVEHLDQVTPWMQEMEWLSPSMARQPGDQTRGVFDVIQGDEVASNERVLTAWRAEIRKRLYAAAFGTQTDWIHSAARRSLQAALKACNAVEPQPPSVLDGICRAYGSTWEQQQAEEVALAEIQATLLAIHSGQMQPMVAKPILRDTTLRNSCFHKLWYARELTLDREPMTLDKLK